MQTLALKKNNHTAVAMELSTLEHLKSFHFGGVVGIFKEGSSKAFRVLFYTIVLLICLGYKTLCHMFTYAYIYKKKVHLSHLLYSSQQIELGCLFLLFATLVWIFTYKYNNLSIA